MSIRQAALVLIVVGLSIKPACGQLFDYASGYSGWVFLNDYEGVTFSGPHSGSFSEGWLLGGALGKNLCHGYRFETEFFYRNNRGDQWTGALGPVNWDGRLNSFSSMGNVLKDVDCLTWKHTTPYAGGGIGVALLDGEFATPFASHEIDQTVFAYQGILGLRTKLTCRLSLLTEYRYFGTSKARVVEQFSNDDIGTLSIDSHNALIGLSLSR